MMRWLFVSSTALLVLIPFLLEAQAPDKLTHGVPKNIAAQLLEAADKNAKTETAKHLKEQKALAGKINQATRPSREAAAAKIKKTKDYAALENEFQALAKNFKTKKPSRE